MNLNRISVGGGLAVLGCSIFALAGAMVVSSGGNPAQAASPMFAGDRKGEAVLRLDGGAEMMAGAACVAPGEPQSWFGAVRSLPDCVISGSGFEGPLHLGSPRMQDVNGDGRQELFVFSGSAIIPSFPGEWMDSSLVVLRRALSQGTEVVFENIPVLPRELLAEWVVANTSWTGAYIDWTDYSGWYDLDQDDDLDLILMLRSNQGAPRYVWLENTGFEKPNFLAGDINQDGYVDGVDIAQLLSDWTGG